MSKTTRPLMLDICDYNKKVVCSLYDNASKGSGQAFNVFINTERNGWRELTFSVPSVIQTENGPEENYILQYLKADYFIRSIEETETDWFIISEPKITHNGFSKQVDVVAGHVSQLLRTKNLGLEFSDEYGSNIGTAEDLLTTILEGTGWSVGDVYEFTEERTGEIKKRSLTASSRTGAFKLIQMVCDLFEAKAIYHGDSRTVDLLPLNPFEDFSTAKISELLNAEVIKPKSVLELHYGSNVKNITRTMNTDNIKTKLYAYGAYGDKTYGYCGIDECKHTEYRFTLTSTLASGQTYYFTVKDDSDTDISYHFTSSGDANGDVLVFSLLDPASMMYVWNETTKTAHIATKGIAGTKLTGGEKTEVPNLFSFVMDFDYYRQAGLLSDNMINAIANYQKTSPELYQVVQDAASDMADWQTKLSEDIGSIDFCKLDVLQKVEDSYLKLELDKSTYSDGVIYRTDYDKGNRNYFKWRACDKLDTKGDPINTATSILYILHPKADDTDEFRWYTAYLKELDNEDDPSVLTFWIPAADADIDVDNDMFLLFSYNGINGHLGTLQSTDEATLQSIEKLTKLVTEDHPVYFVKTAADVAALPVDTFEGYAWAYAYDDQGITGGTIDPTLPLTQLYFCYKADGDTTWQRVNIIGETTDNIPYITEGVYLYNWRKSILYRRNSGEWIALNSDYNNNMANPLEYKASLSESKIAELFGSIYMYCQTRQRLYDGVPEQTDLLGDSKSVAAGNYYFRDYDVYHTFTLTEALDGSNGDSLVYSYDTNWLTIKKNGIETTIPTKSYRFDAVNWHPENILEGYIMQAGSLSTNNGELIDDDTKCRLNTRVRIVPSTQYSFGIMQNGSWVETQDNPRVTYHFYSEAGLWLSCVASTTGFTSPGNAYYVRPTLNITPEEYTTRYGNYIIAKTTNLYSDVIIENLNYSMIEVVGPIGKRIGIIDCLKRLMTTADDIYITKRNALIEAQNATKQLENNMIEAVGDLWREGWMQDASYVDGDEDRLYADALKNIKKISAPESTYTVDFLDLFDSNQDDKYFGASDQTIAPRWPDIDISSAVHLVDNEIGVNTWAYLDKVQKCYDKPWETKIVINTNLTTVGQHSFNDVMANIASVSATVKDNISKYNANSSTSVQYIDMEDILSRLVTMSRLIENEGGRITEMENDITGHSFQLKLTASELSATLQKVTETQEQIAKISITPEAIQSIVETKVTETVDRKLGYDLSIFPANGLFLSAQTTSVRLDVTIRKVNADVTSEFENEDITWSWTAGSQNYSITGKSITVTKTGVTNGTTTVAFTFDTQQLFTCECYVDVDSQRVALMDSCTVADLTASEGNVVEVYIANNKQTVQMYYSDTTTYTPNWSTSPLVLTPVVSSNGTTVSSGVTAVWTKRYDNGIVQSIGQGESYSSADNTLTVTANIPTTISGNANTSVTYICTATYNGSTVIAEKTFSLLQESSPLTIDLFSATGMIYDANTASASCTLTLYHDGTDKANDATKVWKVYYGSATTTLTQTGSTCTISNPATTYPGGFLLICEATYNGVVYRKSLSFMDKTAELSSLIISSAGNILYNGVGTSSLICKLYQQGTEVDATGTAYTYNWTRLDKDGQPLDVGYFDTSKTITIDTDDVPDATTFVCYATNGTKTTQCQIIISTSEKIITGEEPAVKTPNMLWLDNGVLKRWTGSAWVETSGLTEQDITNIKTYSSKIAQYDNAIEHMVQSEELDSRMSSLVQQTDESLKVTLQKAQKYTDDELSPFKNSVEKWMQFSDEGLTLGRSDSSFKAKLDEEKLGFYQGDNEVSYFGNNSMYITNARVTNSFAVGTNEGWFDWVMMSKGLGMKWKSSL